MTRRRDKRIIPLCTGIFVALFAFVFLINRNNTENADAADFSKFDPGNIISDYMMSNYNSMTEAEIQQFLTSKNSCNNRDHNYYNQLSSANPNISWHWKDDHFVCLSEELFGDGMVIGEGKTAAKIIYETAQKYKINPQSLIVLIEKESGLITDPIPNSYDYRTMTGFGCPDTAPCDSKYFGFKNQLEKAAALFREVLDGGWTNYPLGENYIQYNPDRNCGGSIVNIKNLATSSLYRYTPYQPNAATLAAGRGTAHCGAYGNRNFYSYFSDWFGDPTEETIKWQDMAGPRMMTVIQNTLIVDAKKTQTTDTWLTIGDSYQFSKKTTIYWGGKQQTCLQRQEDEGTDRCVLSARLEEFSIDKNIVTFAKPQQYSIQQWTCVVDITTASPECGIKAYNTGDTISISKTIQIGDTKYLIDDSFKNNKYAILEKRTATVLNYEKIGPVLMKLTKNSHKQKISDGQNVQTLTTTANQFINIAEKITVAGKEYYRTTVDSGRDSEYVIPAEVLATEIFADFKIPRNLSFNHDVYSFNLLTKEQCVKYNKGEIKKFIKKIDYDGKTFYQDKDESGSQCAIDPANLYETSYNFNNPNAVSLFTNFLRPRELKVVQTLYPINIEDGQTCDDPILSGARMKYTTKVTINGENFYRDENYALRQLPCAVPAKYLYEI